MINLKNRAVKTVQFHVGADLGFKVLSSASIGKDFVERMELLDYGVYVYSKNPRDNKESEDIIPFTNIIRVRLMPEVEMPKEEKSKAKSG